MVFHLSYLFPINKFLANPYSYSLNRFEWQLLLCPRLVEYSSDSTLVTGTIPSFGFGRLDEPACCANENSDRLQFPVFGSQSPAIVKYFVFGFIFTLVSAAPGFKSYIAGAHM